MKRILKDNSSLNVSIGGGNAGDPNNTFNTNNNNTVNSDNNTDNGKYNHLVTRNSVNPNDNQDDRDDSVGLYQPSDQQLEEVVRRQGTSQENIGMSAENIRRSDENVAKSQESVH